MGADKNTLRFRIFPHAQVRCKFAVMFSQLGKDKKMAGHFLLPPSNLNRILRRKTQNNWNLWSFWGKFYLSEICFVQHIG